MKKNKFPKIHLTITVFLAIIMITISTIAIYLTQKLPQQHNSDKKIIKTEINILNEGNKITPLDELRNINKKIARKAKY